MMNFDWFQPQKRRSDFSVGVLYLVLMNLSREERFKLENVSLALLKLFQHYLRKQPH